MNFKWIYGALAVFEYKLKLFCSSFKAKEIVTSLIEFAIGFKE